ncbi:MAG: hypothetical protein RSC91_00490 [Clostridia bacterium]
MTSAQHEEQKAQAQTRALMRPMGADGLRPKCVSAPQHQQDANAPYYLPNEPQPYRVVERAQSRAVEWEATPVTAWESPISEEMPPVAGQALPRRRSRMSEQPRNELPPVEQAHAEAVPKDLPREQTLDTGMEKHRRSRAEQPDAARPFAERTARDIPAPMAAQPMQPMQLPPLEEHPMYPDSRYPQGLNENALMDYQSAASRTGAQPAQRSGTAYDIEHAVSDEDMTDELREDAVPTSRMATPTPVSFAALMPQKKNHKGLWITLLAVALLLAIGVALWATGTLNGLLGNAQMRPMGDSLPAIFNGGETVTQGSIEPAITPKAAQVSSFSANTETASVPATIKFMLKTTAEVAGIRLMNEQGYAMPAAVESVKEGDGILWTYQVTLDTAYEGNVYAYVRDENGTWTDGGVSCKITVK